MDPNGNKYYERLPNPETGRKNPIRWYESPYENYYPIDLPTEWTAWLRRLRVDPPTTEEIADNLAIAAKKRQNAALLEAKLSADRLAAGECLPSAPLRGPAPYPTYPDLSGGDPQRFYK